MRKVFLIIPAISLPLFIIYLKTVAFEEKTRHQFLQTGQWCQSAAYYQWTYDQSQVFPADRSLLQPEDGKALADGRIVVSHEANGLHIIEQDGSHRPFGKMKAAGYEHTPPQVPGGAKVVFLEKR